MSQINISSFQPFQHWTGAEVKILWNNYVSNIAADALVSCVIFSTMQIAI